MSNDFIERLRHGPVLCDGAMGTQLHAHGITFERSLDGLNLTQPEVVLSVHRGYVEAGADLLETNTFGGNRFRLLEHDLEDRVAEINRLACGWRAKRPMSRGAKSTSPDRSGRWACASHRWAA
jgi:homocysteine S-methyltransferase